MPAAGLEPELARFGLLLVPMMAGRSLIVVPVLMACVAASRMARMAAAVNVGAVGVGGRRSGLGDRVGAAQRLKPLFVVDMKPVVRKADRFDRGFDRHVAE